MWEDCRGLHELVGGMGPASSVLIGSHTEDTKALVGASEKECQRPKRMFLSIASGRVVRTRALQ